VAEIGISRLVFWDDLDVMFDVSNAELDRALGSLR
jgi:hypothetical protein